MLRTFWFSLMRVSGENTPRKGDGVFLCCVLCLTSAVFVGLLLDYVFKRKKQNNQK